MNITDCILIIPLIYAIIKGFKDGVILQLGGLIGIIIGILLAVNYSNNVVQYFGWTMAFSKEIAFIVILILTICLIGLIGAIISRIFNFVGLGFINKFGGAILGFIKMCFILAILLVIFDNINEKTDMVNKKLINDSVIYHRLESVFSRIIPSVDNIKKIFDQPDDL